MSVKSAFTFADFFAGIGGFRLGLEAVGGRCVFSCEKDKYARETYKANHVTITHPFPDDVMALAPDDIPDCDLWCGGFPCQPYSLAGKRKGEADERSEPLIKLLDLIKVKRPKVIFLENVPLFKRYPLFQKMQERLEAMGYHVSSFDVDSRGWVPQKRKRLFIVASLLSPFVYLDDMPEARPPLASILEDWQETEGYQLGDATWEGLQAHKEKHQKAGSGFGYTLADLDRQARTIPARYGRDGAECLIVDDRYTLSDKLWGYYQSNRMRKDTGGFGCIVNNPTKDQAVTLMTSYGDNPESVLINQPSSNPRKLTPREVARCFGFPDSFRIVVSNSQAYKQFGNSVVVPVIESIGRQIVEAYFKSGLSQIETNG